MKETMNRFDHNRINCLHKKGKQKRKNITRTIVDYQCIVIYICGSVGIPLDKYTNRQLKIGSLVKNNKWQKFLGNSVVRIPCFHCQGAGFDPWLGELRSCKQNNKQDIFNLIYCKSHFWKRLNESVFTVNCPVCVS